jgi:YVTN family beta-propeller protein
MKKLCIIIILSIVGLSTCLPVGTANAQTAYIANSGDSTVSVINVATNTVTKSIKISSNPSSVSVSPDGSKVYVGNSGTFSTPCNTVSVIKSATNTVSAIIVVGSTPYGVSVSPDGSNVYIANYNSNTISVINSTTNNVTVSIPVGIAPYGVSVSPDGSKIYVANNGSNNTISVINSATNKVTATITVGYNPQGVSVSPDGSKVYVTNYNKLGTVSVINTATNTVSATIPVGNSPFGISVSPDGSRVYVTNFNDNTVSVISTATNTVTDTIKVGTNPAGVSVSPDGSKVYVVNYSSGTVSIINSATNVVTDTIKVGSDPLSFGNFISTYTACSAQFTIAADTTTPHHYIVTNNALGVPPLKYLWSWGDGTYDTIAYPSHTYSTAGGYKICLTITDSAGCTSTYCDSSYLSKNPNSIITVDVVPKVPTGIKENELSNQIKVYPNPASWNIQVSGIKYPASSIEIYNVIGEKVYQLVNSHSSLGISPMTNAPMTNTPITINIADFPCGVYVVQVKTEKGVMINKFIKE